MPLDLSTFKPIQSLPTQSSNSIDLSTFKPVSQTSDKTIPVIPPVQDNSFSGQVKTDIANRGNQILNAFNTNQSDFSKGYQTGGAVLGLTNDVASQVPGTHVGPAVVSSIAQNIKNVPGILGTISQGVQDLAPYAGHLFDALKSSLGPVWDNFTKQHPEAAANLQATVEAAKFAGTAETTKQLIDTIPNTTFNSAPNVAAKQASDLQNVQDLITPKSGVNQTRLALLQDRIVPGTEPTLFKAGTPDTILPSDATNKSISTIIENIPNAGQMDAPTLFQSINGKISEIAQALEPEMQKVGVQPTAIDNMTNAWEQLKAEQMTAAPATEETNVAKIQSQFEQRLAKIDNATSLNDVWKETQAYDNSIPESVKQANALSPRSLQDEKTMWLNNRSILTELTHNTSGALGETFQQEFSDMSNLYNAKKNILSNAPLQKKILPSKIGQFLKTPAGKIIVGGAKLGVIGESIKGLVR